MSDKQGKTKIIYDLILILTLLAISLSALFIYMSLREQGRAVRVTVDGREELLVSLDVDGEYSLNGGTNILRVRDGRASVIYADCPDKVCVNMGEISMELDTIVCLPNEVFVEIVTD